MVQANVARSQRDAIRRAHSATHLLHHALRSTLGSHAQQQGSKVEADALRFDFTNMNPLSETQVEEVQTLVSQRLDEHADIRWQTLPLSEARQQGAMMLFGEKYPDPVRMVSMGNFSHELCGGTHLENTADVIAFELLSEESVSSNVRRVVALTGPKALGYRAQTQEIANNAAKLLGCQITHLVSEVQNFVGRIRQLKKCLSSGAVAEVASQQVGSQAADELSFQQIKATVREASRSLNVRPEDLCDRIEAMLEDEQSLQEELTKFSQAGQVTAEQMLSDAKEIADSLVVVRVVECANPNLMRQWIDQLRKKSPAPIAALLITKLDDDKVVLVAGLSKLLVDRGLRSR